MTRTLVALLVGLFALPSTAAELRTRLHRPSRGLQVRLTPFDIQPRTEREVCQLIELPSAKEVEFRDLTIAMPAGVRFGVTAEDEMCFAVGGRRRGAVAGGAWLLRRGRRARLPVQRKRGMTSRPNSSIERMTLSCGTRSTCMSAMKWSSPAFW